MFHIQFFFEFSSRSSDLRLMERFTMSGASNFIVMSMHTVIILALGYQQEIWSLLHRIVKSKNI